MQGSVYVRFKIEADGTMSDFKVVRSISPELDEEALRVAKLLPLWIPGTSFGRAASSYYSLPITFSLK